MTCLKACTTCHIEKPATEEFFYRQKGCRLDMSPRCRECARQAARRRYESFDADDRAKHNAAGLAWNKANPEKTREFRRQWRLRNPEKARAKDARGRERNRERRREQFKSWYERNREAKDEAARQWKLANPDARKRHYDNWRTNNPESYVATRKRAHAKFFSVARNRLDRKVRAGIHKYLSGEGVSRSWQEHVGYTLADLAAHIERQFLKGMSWDNMGEWHLDHITPLSAFGYTSVTDPDFRAAWALTNLRPLWARENLAKSARRTLLL
jgi:hypothetical protein